MKVRCASLILVLPLLLASSVGAQTLAPTARAAGSKPVWQMDTSHSEVAFTVRHLTGKVRGRFNTWSGTITGTVDNWNNAVVNVVIQASSIDTKNEQRDKHLRSDDFFDVEKYPEITFKSTSIKRNGDSVTVAGKLTMKGVTKPAVLTGKLTKSTFGPKPRLEFQVMTTINRLDYGVAYNRLLEGGGTTLGDEVAIDIVVAAVQQE